ncbi:PAQR family membrane homeostasis protein TrhA [Cochleicola gelatinilyticus]|uniref:Hemolysin III family protein n=1 Tax=Cochleicola gelatinilyticus TaxID=1763537 RepID=A0A167H6E3_9FLAO|nr:hemolysin III family protein [Cochleicola gelatinilyticus]OAB78262.1 hemolysin III family protein [Cochleicola gelatinilyticus]
MRPQTKKEERWNTLTHGLGFLLGIVGTFLLVFDKKYASISHVVSVLLYGASLLILYFSSTIYHYVEFGPKKVLFRKFDHISIYLLIAGTYSPILLIALPQSIGWLLFYIIWGFACIGIVLKVFFTGRFEIISLVLYLIMGWLIIFDILALKNITNDSGIELLIAGGVAYTGGIVFYVLDRMYFNHVIWHLFVMAGSLFHFLYIYRNIISLSILE